MNLLIIASKAWVCFVCKIPNDCTIGDVRYLMLPHNYYILKLSK